MSTDIYAMAGWTMLGTAVLAVAYSACLAALLWWMKVFARRNRAADRLPRWELFASTCLHASPGLLAALVGTVSVLGIVYGAPVFFAGGIIVLIVASRVSRGHRSSWAWFPLGYAALALVVVGTLTIVWSIADPDAWGQVALLNAYLVACTWNGWRIVQRSRTNTIGPALRVDPDAKAEDAEVSARASALPHTTGRDRATTPGEQARPSGPTPAAGGHA